MVNQGWDADFWRGKRVFVTGHTGFVGSWLSFWLVQRGAKVAGYALAPHTKPALYNALGLDACLHSTIGDLCDHEALTNALHHHQPEIVIHLAAQAIVGEAHRNAAETWRVNALGTVMLLEALRACDSLKAVTVFTTDKVYENNEDGKPCRETDAIGGYGMYDSSKAATELAVRAFVHAGHVPCGVATIRAGNIIGGGDFSAERLVPDCVRAYSAGQPVTLRHPQSVRPWQHVLDVAYATMRLSEALSRDVGYQGAWNVGPYDQATYSAAHIAEFLAPLWNQPVAWQQRGEATSFPEAGTLALNSEKIERVLGIRNRLPFEEALRWTSDWYRDYLAAPHQAPEHTLAQIHAYEQLMKVTP